MTLAALSLLSVVPSARAYTVKQTDSGATVRWHANAVSLRLDPSMQSYFNGIQVRDVVSDATQAWAALPGVPELMVSDGTPAPRATTKQRHRQRRLSGPGLAARHQLARRHRRDLRSKSGKIVDTDILVNAQHPFALLAAGPDGPADDFDLRGVLTHELGHVLGLGESYDVRMATMWPNVARGETHQRDLDVDDTTGVETAYAEALPSELAAASKGGCGGASVVVHRSTAPSPAVWILCGSGLVVAGLWLRARSRAGRGRGAPLFALVLLFGAPFRGESAAGESQERVEVLRTLALRRLPLHERRAGLAQSAKSASQQVRMAAAAVLERTGAREDSSLASQLSLDEDPEVRRIGKLALARLRTAPPSEVVDADAPAAKARLGALLNGATDVVQGEAVTVGTRTEQGLIWSRYLVHDEEEVVEVQIPGGSMGEITQVVSEQEAPADGSQLVVARHAKGPHSWAHLRDGVIYGGSLGDGPAIQWQ